MHPSPNGMSRARLLWAVFASTFYISAFTFGGGFVIITFMKRKFVDELHWISEEEMLDLTALAQATPGAIAVNAAILVGWHLAGFGGMLVAVLGTILPPMLIMLLLFFFYAAFAANRYVALVLRGMQAGVAAILCSIVCDLFGNVSRQKEWLSYLIMVAAFAATYFFRVNVAFIVLGAVAAGLGKALWLHRREVRGK